MSDTLHVLLLTRHVIRPTSQSRPFNVTLKLAIGNVFESHQRQLVDRSSPCYMSVGHKKITRWRIYTELAIKIRPDQRVKPFLRRPSREASENSSRLPMNSDDRTPDRLEARQLPFRQMVCRKDSEPIPPTAVVEFHYVQSQARHTQKDRPRTP